MQSEQIGDLAAALAKAQAAFAPLKKDRTAKAGSYEYDYADLADLIAATKAPLSANGLAVSQTFRYQDGHMVLVTTLMHTGGQWLDSEYPIGNYSKPQELGSAITYGRRYSWQAIVGIAPVGEDDDGKKAQDAPPPPAREAAPVSSDAAAIVHLAAELEQITGVNSEQIIRDASQFKGDNDKWQSFTDPTKVRSAKWLKGVRAKLERELQAKGAKAAVGEEPIPF